VTRQVRDTYENPFRCVANGDVSSTVVAGSGATLTMSNGDSVIDFSSASFGYSHGAVTTAVAAQMSVLPQSTRMFLNHPLADLVTRIAEVLPGDLAVTYPCNSASEACEGALKLSLGYQRRSGRSTFLATTGSDHGHTLGAAAISSVRSTAEIQAAAPFATQFVTFGDTTTLRKAAYDQPPAGIVVEPIPTAQGLVIPSRGFLRQVRDLCDQVGALMIVNETTTGLGRTGQLLAADHYEVVPDILVLGAALGGGILPVGAYVTTQAINDRVYGSCGPWMHGSATGGNPLACAAAVAALDVIIRDQIATSCHGNGVIIADTLQSIAQRYPEMIADTVGIGHLAAVRWRSPAAAEAVVDTALSAGLLLHAGRFDPDWTGLRPPLTASRAEISAGLAILEDVVECSQRKAAV
jgi:putrescine aminotransferase